MVRLALRNLLRRPLRTVLTLSGMALAVAVLSCLSAFGHGYRRALSDELNGMGMQLMLVPLGEVQPDTEPHERTRHEQRPGDRAVRPRRPRGGESRPRARARP